MCRELESPVLALVVQELSCLYVRCTFSSVHQQPYLQSDLQVQTSSDIINQLVLFTIYRQVTTGLVKQIPKTESHVVLYLLAQFHLQAGGLDPTPSIPLWQMQLSHPKRRSLRFSISRLSRIISTLQSRTIGLDLNRHQFLY